jgi:two-component system CheB/CheR fusion protein
MILIVDDDAATRDSLKLLLECDGLETRGFASAQEFLDQYRPGECDCLILDLHMPGIGGLDLLEMLRQDGNSVPVVAITALAMPQYRRRAQALGALALLEKPYAANELMELVQQATAKAGRGSGARK